jgi:kinetochore protein Mis12/MTW1
LQQKHLKRLLAKAARASRRHAKQAKTRLDRLSFIQPEQLQTLGVLAKDTDELYAAVSTLPPYPQPTDADVHISGIEPGKRQWEVGKAGYLNWASAQLVQQAQRSSSGPVVLDAQETIAATSKEEMAVALRELELQDQ